MTEASTWHHVTRIAWLSGGIVAVNNPGPSVEIGAGLGGLLLDKLTLPAYPSLAATLQKRGFAVIGTSFIQTADEAMGIAPAQFFALSRIGTWRARDVQQKWRQVAHFSAVQDQMLLSDIAARLASGIASAQSRLQHLSHAYSSQLRSHVRTLPIEDYTRFKDTNSPAVYLAIHAMFWELAVLRDTLAEFAAPFSFELPRLTTMKGLVKRLRTANCAHPLAGELVAASNETARGWLSLFSAYRNLFTHSAPLQEAAGIAFAVQEARTIADDFRVPALYFPLPADAACLIRRRSAGALHQTFEEHVSASRIRQPDRKNEPDALDYLANCFDQMVGIAEGLLDNSPIEPREIHLTKADIIGEIKIRRG